MTNSNERRDQPTAPSGEVPGAGEADLHALFDEVDTKRLRSSRSIKWTKHPSDVIPAFIADMDFAPPPAISAALTAWLTDGFLGYPGWEYHGRVQAVASSYLHRRYGMVDDPGRLLLQTDVVQGMHAAMEVWSEPGDAILVLTPIYPPFLGVIREQGRRLLEYRMTSQDGRYGFDVDALRALVAEHRPSMLLLCNPHNPTGRVFTVDELTALAALAIEFEMTVVSDEIHSELVFAAHEHMPFETLSDEVRARTVTITSASKACNLAGLRTAVLIFGTKALRQQFDAHFSSHLLGVVSVPGMVAMETAWSDPSVARWQAACVGALEERAQQFRAGICAGAPELGLVPLEGTYLAWVDFSAVKRSYAAGESVATHLLTEARLALSEGPTFGSGLEKFARVNLATSPAIVDEIVTRIVGWVDRQR